MANTVGDLIEALQKFDPDMIVRTRPENAKSRQPIPYQSPGFQSSWLYWLDATTYGGRGRDLKPVVWL